MVGLQYDVVVRAGALDSLKDVVGSVGRSSRVVIISDSNVARRYGKRVAKQLGGAPVFTMPAGEKHKHRKTWATLTDKLLAAHFGRDTIIVALGGGVVGDVAGFVAATYMRGVPVIQVPTSLLAMVDASVGGKTGVDTRAGKNLVGAFHQPAAVVIDPAVLSTLPPAQIAAGFAEILKHGVVADADHFAAATAFAATHKLDGKDGIAELTALIARSVEIKSAVVAADEKEGGLRKILNFGHTIGHALESATKFRLLHGHAVALGMQVEARIAEQLGIATHDVAESIAIACKTVGLPTSLPKIPAARLVALTRSDKKARGGKVQYALPTSIGTMAGEKTGWTVAVKESVVRNVLSKK